MAWRWRRTTRQQQGGEVAAVWRGGAGGRMERRGRRSGARLVRTARRGRFKTTRKKNQTIAAI
jgi:hypothetical protein